MKEHFPLPDNTLVLILKINGKRYGGAIDLEMYKSSPDTITRREPQQVLDDLLKIVMKTEVKKTS